MHTEFVARRAVTILGVDYAPGAVIDDASIPPGVLATLTSTRRIAQRIRNDDGTLVDENARFPIDPTGSRNLRPVEPVPRPPTPDPPQGPAPAPAPPYEPEHGSEAHTLAWREAWQNGVAVRPGFTGTFRAYLMARCGKAEMITSGAVTDLLARLIEAGIQPVPPVATMRPPSTTAAGEPIGRPRKERGATP